MKPKRAKSKKLIIFYSFEGNTKLIAECIAKAVKADILQLKPKKEIMTHGFMKYLWGGRQVVMKQKPELMPLNKDANKYDILFIGTPVWAFNYAPPLRTFFSTAEITGKKIALFCCDEGSKGKTFENMKRELPDNEFIGEIEFLKPLKDKENNKKKTIEWVKALNSISD